MASLMGGVLRTLSSASQSLSSASQSISSASRSLRNVSWSLSNASRSLSSASRSLSNVSQSSSIMSRTLSSVSRVSPSVMHTTTLTHIPGSSSSSSFPLGVRWLSVSQETHRYHSEKVAKGPLRKNYGYEEKLHQKGMLPHMKHLKRLPIPIYRPKNSWAEKRALFGQNDYIDILGTGELRPTDVVYSVPFWLRGFKGNEYQMLLRKRKLFGTTMSRYRPTKFRQMNYRIKILYRYLNQKTKSFYTNKA